MEFSFNIHHILKEEITVVDRQLVKHGNDRFGFQQIKKMLYEIVDTMGEASAKAQGLHGSITTGPKLDIGNQRLYIMKDINSNTVLGFLKVGTKKLFVYDHSKMQHEMEPLCVLDFYVHESRQRMGCGRKLFAEMLKKEGIPVQHLAIDRPSIKFSSFLQKHYKLKGTIPQVNNYVIFDGFFNNRDVGNNRGRRRNAEDKPPLISNRPSSGNNRYVHNTANHSKGRFHALCPKNSHRGGDVNGEVNGQNCSQATEDSLNNINLATSARHNGLGTGDVIYSRHRPPSAHNSSSSASSYHRTQSFDTPHSARKTENFNRQTSGHMSYVSGVNSASRAYCGQPDSLPPKQQETSSTVYKDPSSHSGYMGRSSNSNHKIETLIGSVTPPRTLGTRATPPPTHHANQPPPMYSGVGGNGTASDTNLRSGSTPQLPQISSNSANVLRSRPPSGSRRQVSSKPPLLQRDGPPTNYKHMLNMHQGFQGRGGHLMVNPSPPGIPMQAARSAFSGIAPNSQDISWTVGNYLRNQQRHHNSSRLW